jgi:aspartyl protease family protein
MYVIAQRILFAMLLTMLAATATAITKVTVVGLFKDTAIVVIDGTRRLLRSGDTSPEGVTLVSADSKEAVLEIDGEQKRYGLGGQIGGTYKKPDQVTVRIWPTPNRMYAVLGSINGYPVDFIVDTGATLVSLSGQQARRLGIDYRVVGTPSHSSTASGIARIYLVSLDRVKVGDIELRNVGGAVHDGDFPPATLLGMSFLSRLNMRQDGQVLELQTKY